MFLGIGKNSSEEDTSWLAENNQNKCREKYSEYILGWPKSLLHFFHKIKDSLLIFTNNFIDLDILSMPAISRYSFLVSRGQWCC